MARLELILKGKKLDISRYRQIGLGIRKVFRVKPPGKAALRRNLFLMSIFCLLMIFAVSKANAKTCYLIKVDGRRVAATQNRSVFEPLLSRITEAEAARSGVEVKMANKVTIEPVARDQVEKILTDDELAKVLRENIEFIGKGYVIAVNGRDVVALASEEEARAVLSDLRGTYIQAIASSGQATVEDVYIRENVEIKQEDVPTVKFRNKDDAVQLLRRGTDKILNYVVQRGDSLWSIAQANSLTVDQLLRANPNITDETLIQEGQNLSLVVADPYVTITSKEIVTTKVPIPYDTEVSYDSDMWPWNEKVVQEGQNGEKEITEEVTRENGKEISRVTLQEKVLSYPTPEKLVKGSRKVPPMSSGAMFWPVDGEITSYYGWRWGSFHEGVDIAADTGTPIHAADSGVVSFAGWSGGYGYLVKIDHGDGKETWYGHQSKIAVDVGQHVSKGDVIGYVGSTGNSTGPHCHFEVHVGGSTVNPMSYFK